MIDRINDEPLSITDAFEKHRRRRSQGAATITIACIAVLLLGYVAAGAWALWRSL